MPPATPAKAAARKLFRFLTQTVQLSCLRRVQSVKRAAIHARVTAFPELCRSMRRIFCRCIDYEDWANHKDSSGS